MLSCTDGILDEVVEVELVMGIPVWHHGVVWGDCGRVDHHVLVVGAIAVECVHGLEVYCVVHDDGVVDPGGSRQGGGVHDGGGHEWWRGHDGLLLDGLDDLRLAWKWAVHGRGGRGVVAGKWAFVGKGPGGGCSVVRRIGRNMAVV